MAVFTRVRQTLQALTASLRPVEDDLAAEYLTPELFALFMTMRRSDRQHHVRVLKYLLAQNSEDTALHYAALLHDVGKTRVSISIFHRILAVLGKRFFPRRFEQWGQGEPTGWRKAFVVSVQHPAWGAEFFDAHADNKQASDLIRYHQDSVATTPLTDTQKELLQQLQIADDAS